MFRITFAIVCLLLLSCENEPLGNTKSVLVQPKQIKPVDTLLNQSGLLLLATKNTGEKPSISKNAFYLITVTTINNKTVTDTFPGIGEGKVGKMYVVNKKNIDTPSYFIANGFYFFALAGFEGNYLYCMPANKSNIVVTTHLAEENIIYNTPSGKFLFIQSTRGTRDYNTAIWKLKGRKLKLIKELFIPEEQHEYETFSSITAKKLAYMYLN